MFFNFVSLVLKALLVKAESRVPSTEIRISLTYLLTRMSMYGEFHPQFKSLSDLLTKIDSPIIQKYLQV